MVKVGHAGIANSWIDYVVRPGFTFRLPRLAGHAGEQEGQADCSIA
jgi:hypothetical protein